MCRTLAYRHACHHTTLHTVARCRLTYVSPNTLSNTPLCSGHRTPSTELVRLATPCLACEYRAFTSAWEERITAVRSRLDTARQALRDLDRERECAVDDDWNCCEDLDFADESLFSGESWGGSSDDSDMIDDDYSDWFSFEKADASTSAWEAHGLLSQGRSPQRNVRPSALRTKLVGEEKVAAQMLADVRDEYEAERLRAWSSFTTTSATSPKSKVASPKAPKTPGKRQCGLSRLRDVTNASDLPEQNPVVPAEVAPASTAATTRKLPQRRRTEPAVLTPATNIPMASTTISTTNIPTARAAAAAAWTDSPLSRSFPSTMSRYKPKPAVRGTVIRSCSLEQSWSFGMARSWLDDGQDSGIALPDYGF